MSTFVKLNIFNKVCEKWRLFGVLLGFEVAKLDSLYDKNFSDAFQCYLHVMSMWMRYGEANGYPSTWEGFFTLLKDVNCIGVADQLLSELSRPVQTDHVKTQGIKFINYLT